MLNVSHAEIIASGAGASIQILGAVICVLGSIPLASSIALGYITPG